MVVVIDRRSSDFNHMSPSLTDDLLNHWHYLTKQIQLKPCLYILTVRVLMYFTLSLLLIRVCVVTFGLTFYFLETEKVFGFYGGREPSEVQLAYVFFFCYETYIELQITGGLFPLSKVENVLSLQNHFPKQNPNGVHIDSFHFIASYPPK